jgi:hypothetical protein
VCLQLIYRYTVIVSVADIQVQCQCVCSWYTGTLPVCLQLIYRYTVSVSAADIQVHCQCVCSWYTGTLSVCLQLIHRYTVSVSAADIQVINLQPEVGVLNYREQCYLTQPDRFTVVRCSSNEHTMVRLTFNTHFGCSTRHQAQFRVVSCAIWRHFIRHAGTEKNCGLWIRMEILVACLKPQHQHLSAGAVRPVSAASCVRGLVSARWEQGGHSVKLTIYIHLVRKSVTRAAQTAFPT